MATETGSRVEAALDAVLRRAETQPSPPTLAAAMRHAVFPGGGRVRPRLLLAVAGACGDPRPALSDAAAAAIELLHCASLVHDDMPCFDDAATRRGRPSVHAAFGAPLALLTGDALIVAAFETLARAAPADPQTAAALSLIVARAVGAPGGIVAGQAWESEPQIDVAAYHRAKTGALFVAASTGGAVAAGRDPGPWRVIGEKLGEAYQVADDLADALGCEADLGKPAGQDAAHARPNAVRSLGVGGAVARLEGLVREAVASIPPCPGAGALADLVMLQARRLAPKDLVRSVA
ncbi:polyprenyl synthetase family protein [Rubrimonas sp.]|uniref:polyprenyl synthetase family protein n=1 Tax=Rubrimonas sp. TaxID=2036015 RepID=UPI002FDEC78A